MSRAARALYRRDLVVISRRPALVAALATHVALIAAFLLAWSGLPRVPGMPGASLYDQQRAIEWALVAVILPWIVCRFVAGERGDAWAVTALVTGVPPTWLFNVRVAALATFAALLVGSGFPLALLARQMAAGSAAVAAAQSCSLAFFAVACVAIALSVTLRVRDPISGWVVSAIASLVLRGFIEHAPVAVSAAAAAVAVALGIALAPSAVAATGAMIGRHA